MTTYRIIALRERFRRELAKAASLDENGYICTKDEAMSAFDRAFPSLDESNPVTPAHRGVK